jgi:hypothetical protein
MDEENRRTITISFSCVCFLHKTEHLIVQIFIGVFFKVNKATINMRRRVEPYVAYG